MTLPEWIIYGELCADHDVAGLTPELKRHLKETADACAEQRVLARSSP